MDLLPLMDEVLRDFRNSPLIRLISACTHGKETLLSDQDRLIIEF